MISRVDEFFIHKFQVLYEWLLDNFGLYKGTYCVVWCGSFFTLVIMDEKSTMMKFLMAALLIWNFFIFSRDWALQHSGQYDALNASAMFAEQSPLIYVMRIIVFPAMMVTAVFATSDAWKAIYDTSQWVAAILLCYGLSLRVRDPEKRHEFATERT